jgi:hypothetical protein
MLEQEQLPGAVFAEGDQAEARVGQQSAPGDLPAVESETPDLARLVSP